jgi:hypothetical protein
MMARKTPASNGPVSWEQISLDSQAAIASEQTTDAARYVSETYGFPCSRQWLAKLAVIGGGPLFRKAGRTPIYAPQDLDAWAKNRIGAPQRSTSDVPPKPAGGVA